MTARNSRFGCRLRVVALAGLTWSAIAGAQGDVDSPTLRDARECSALSSDTARLACYDAVLRDGRGPAAGASSAAPAARADRGSPTTVPPPQAPQGGSAAESVGQVEIPAPRTSAETRPRPGRQVIEEPTAYPVTIVDIPRTRPETVFVTEDGDIWIQNDTRRLNLPDTPFAAELRPGALGSYFLVPEGSSRAVRVRLQ
jgi:hypothetical protein